MLHKFLGFTLATLGLFLAISSPQAQTATISTTALDVSGTANNAVLQNVTSPTYFSNDGQTFLVVRGTSTNPTMRIKTFAQQICGQGVGCAPLADQTFILTSGTTYIVGPFPTGRWNDPTTGLVRVEFTAISAISATAKTLAQ